MCVVPIISIMLSKLGYTPVVAGGGRLSIDNNETHNGRGAGRFRPFPVRRKRTPCHNIYSP